MPPAHLRRGKMRYVVKDTHIRHGAGQDARTYGPGDEIELTEDAAERLGPSVEQIEPEAEVSKIDETAGDGKRRKGR